MRNLIYRLYENRLEAQLDRSNIPQHIAVMLDGNRRWAGKKNASNAKIGHLARAQKIFDFLSWCDDLQVPVVTLYYPNSHVHNVTTSILINSGLEELVCYSNKEYIDKTIQLSLDFNKLINYHETISNKFKNLMNPKKFMKE